MRKDPTTGGNIAGHNPLVLAPQTAICTRPLSITVFNNQTLFNILFVF